MSCVFDIVVAIYLSHKIGIGLYDFLLGLSILCITLCVHGLSINLTTMVVLRALSLWAGIQICLGYIVCLHCFLWAVFPLIVAYCIVRE